MQGCESDIAIFRVKQPAYLTTAGAHALSQTLAGKMLFLHRAFNLPCQHFLNGEKEAQVVLTGAVRRAAATADSLNKAQLGLGVLHGDAMPGNALQSGGEMVMIDLDSVCAGPREWDLVPMYVTAKRFSRNGERRWRAFLKGYDVNEADLADLQAASFIKELSMTIYLCLSAGQSASIDSEIAQRIQMWGAGDLTEKWTNGFTIGSSERSIS